MSYGKLRTTGIFVIVIALVLIVSYFMTQATIYRPQSVSPLAPRNRLDAIDPTPTPRPTTSVPGNLIINPSFEGDYSNCGQSCNVADGWEPFAASNNPPPCIAGEPGCYILCPSNCGDCDPNNVSYGCWWCRPEWKAATLQFPERVHAGEKAQQAFCYGRQCEGGVYQQITVTVGARLRFSAFVENWQCANKLGCGGLSDDPPTGAMTARTGIDPTGGTDYASPNVIWSSPNEGRDYYELLTVEAIAQSDRVTVFLYFMPSWEWAHIHNNIYWDDVSLVVLQPMTEHGYIPLVARNHSGPTPPPTPTPTLTPTPRPGITPQPPDPSAAWFIPAYTEATTETYSITLWLKVAPLIGNIELVMFDFSSSGVQIIDVQPASYFERVDEFYWSTHENHGLTIFALGYAGAGRTGPFATITIDGSGESGGIIPLSRYSTFIGSETGGGLNPPCGSFRAE